MSCHPSTAEPCGHIVLSLSASPPVKALDWDETQMVREDRPHWTHTLVGHAPKTILELGEYPSACLGHITYLLPVLFSF